MTLVFYHCPNSTSSVTEAVLKELNIQHTQILTEIGPNGTKSEEFLKINPNGRVPVIIHNDTVIWESSAITIYLGETFGNEAIYPKGAKRGEVLKWIVWTSATLATAASALSAVVSSNSKGAVEKKSADLVNEEERTEDALKTATKNVSSCLNILDSALQGKNFILGDSYTLADTQLYVIVSWIGYMMDTNVFTNLDKWKKRCTERNTQSK